LYALRLLLRDRAGVFGVTILLLILFFAIFAPQIAPHDPTTQDLKLGKLPPAWSEGGIWEYPLGTDSLGRDLFSRIVYGSRVSLTVGFFGVLIALSLGLVFGLIAGYSGGWTDTLIMGVVNIVLALPYLLFVVVIASVLGRSLFNVIMIFGITDAPLFARIARGETLRLREAGFVESAVSAGVRRSRILFDHILPNMIGSLLTVTMFEMSAMIFYEAGLGFLGLSVPPDIPSWGNMLEAGRQYLQTLPWIATFPGIAIMLTAIGMNLTGEWLRSVLDPRLRGGKM
jgi:ABC-type dipeptide/oligopeptide/nickel transport system permease subunit